MRKVLLLTVMFSGVIALLSGCGTVAETSEMPMVKPGAGEFTTAFKDPVIVTECEIGERVQGEATFGYVFGLIPVGEVLPWNAEQYAIFKACKQANADFLVAPMIVREKKNRILWTSLTVTVIGRAGKYTKFRTVPYEQLQKDKLEEIKANNTRYYKMDGVDGKKVNIVLTPGGGSSQVKDNKDNRNRGYSGDDKNQRKLTVNSLTDGLSELPQNLVKVPLALLTGK